MIGSGRRLGAGRRAGCPGGTGAGNASVGGGGGGGGRAGSGGPGSRFDTMCSREIGRSTSTTLCQPPAATHRDGMFLGDRAIDVPTGHATSSPPIGTI